MNEEDQLHKLLVAELSMADLDIIADITLHEIALVRGETFAKKVDQEINAQLGSITPDVFRQMMDGGLF